MARKLVLTPWLHLRGERPCWADGWQVWWRCPHRSCWHWSWNWKCWYRQQLGIIFATGFSEFGIIWSKLGVSLFICCVVNLAKALNFGNLLWRFCNETIFNQPYQHFRCLHSSLLALFSSFALMQTWGGTLMVTASLTLLTSTIMATASWTSWTMTMMATEYLISTKTTMEMAS